MKIKRKKPVFHFLALFVIFSLFGCVLEKEAACEAVASVKDAAAANVNAADANAAEIEQICNVIYKGDFAAARELLDSAELSRSPAEKQLEQVVSEYEAIELRRKSAREQASSQQLAELDHLKLAADANGLDDVNEITKVLSVVLKACELADKEQKEDLLSKSFVKQAFEIAKAKAAEFESRGKWIEAYTNCYWWLKEIDKDKKEYSDYAEALLERANIASTFQDSPCETRKERFAGVEKKMFVRAIDALKYNYVSVSDYRQMAVKALARCESLAEVVKYSSEFSDVSFELPKQWQFAAWSAALSGLLEEVNRPGTSLSKDKFIDVFERLLEINNQTLKLPEPVLIAQFSEAALSALDAYTVIIWPRSVQDFEKMMTNEFTGVGIEISKEKGLLTVVSLLPDTPAYNSGIDAGDVIEAVDGLSTKDMSIICAVKNITGPAGTKVKLTIRRESWKGTKDITITRAKIVVPTIRGWQRTMPSPSNGLEQKGIEAGRWRYIIDPENKIGYVRITSFSAETASDLEQVLAKLESKGLRGLILDLRDNSGGLLNSAVDVADKFLEGGLIVKTVPRFGVSTYALARKKGTHPNYPLVVLMNGRSASASEIVAGALGDPKHNRAILVGQRTHGKGSVQGITHHPGGGAQLKYTMAYYHLPSGQRVESREAVKKKGRDDWGVAPDLKVELTSDEFKEMIRVQRNNDVLVGAGHDIESRPLKKYSVEETLASDPQLAVALLIARTKLIQQALQTANPN